jgi:hypothetical protein
MYRGSVQASDDVPHGEDGREDCSARAGGAKARNICGARAAVELLDERRGGGRKEEIANGSSWSGGGFGAICNGVGLSGPTWWACPGAPISAPYLGWI